MYSGYKVMLVYFTIVHKRNDSPKLKPHCITISSKACALCDAYWELQLAEEEAALKRRPRVCYNNMVLALSANYTYKQCLLVGPNNFPTLQTLNKHCNYNYLYKEAEIRGTRKPEICLILLYFSENKQKCDSIAYSSL